MTLPESSFGSPLLRDPKLSRLEKAYIRTFGVPVLGLRIRARHLSPVIERLRGRSYPAILDAGCGRGLFTCLLARSFPESSVTGVDIDRDQLDRNTTIAARSGYQNCHFAVHDVTDLTILGPCDLILSTDNLEHLEDDRKQCRVFHDTLRPGGGLLIHTPHITRNLFGWRRENFMGIEGHVRPGYTLKGLTGMLEDAGFHIEEAFYTYNSIETLANDLSYLITAGRERRKVLYAAVFPLLLLLSQLDRSRPRRDGSGLVVLARKPTSEPEGGSEGPPAAPGREVS